MADGPQPDRIEWDEENDERPRREVIIARPDGTTYSAEFPEDADLGDVLAPGETVVSDPGASTHRTEEQ